MNTIGKLAAGAVIATLPLIGTGCTPKPKDTQVENGTQNSGSTQMKPDHSCCKPKK